MTLFGWIWRGTILFVILTIVYIALTLLNRWKERTRLAAEFTEATTELSKDDFMAKGMKRYNRSLKAKLFLTVYLIPVAIGAFLVYLGSL